MWDVSDGAVVEMLQYVLHSHYTISDLLYLINAVAWETHSPTGYLPTRHVELVRKISVSSA